MRPAVRGPIPWIPARSISPGCAAPASHRARAKARARVGPTPVMPAQILGLMRRAGGGALGCRWHRGAGSGGGSQWSGARRWIPIRSVTVTIQPERAHIQAGEGRRDTGPQTSGADGGCTRTCPRTTHTPRG